MQISSSVKLAIDNSINFARSVGSSKIETEHLLYGLLIVEDNRAVRLLKEVGVNKTVLKNVILKYSKTAGGTAPTEIGYAKSVSAIFAKSSEFCDKNNKNPVEIEEILYFLINNRELRATKFLSEIFKINLNMLEGKLASLIGILDEKSKSNGEKKLSSGSVVIPEKLSAYGENLSKKVSDKGFQKIIGRDEETARVIEILCRKTKNNPVLLGEPGVGKTSVIEGLAQKIELGEVPDILAGKVIFSLDLASLVSGTKFRGSLEQRLKEIIGELANNPDIIIFIDEIHMLVQAGSGEGDISPVDILKPYLARGELRIVGATTLSEYREYIEKDPALERRFQSVKVDEPSEEDAILILKGIRESYENFHKVKISDEAIEAAVRLSVRYITNRFLPDKAIDLIDEACSKIKVNASSIPEEVKSLNLKIKNLEMQKELSWKNENFLEADRCKKMITELQTQIEKIRASEFQSTGRAFGEVCEEDIREIVSSWTNIPVKRLSSSEREKLLNLENLLSEKVIGQSGAVSEVAKAIRRSRAGIGDPNRPIGSFFFLGSTGVGKTELAKAMGEVLFDGENSIVRFDMSEFKESHAVSRLIGAPPGYVGHDDGGELTEAVRKNPYSLVLFDEIEKAHPDIFNILLQILDDGRLTDSSGKLINFKNTVIILTSNNGVQDLIRRRKFERENPSEPKVSAEDFLMEKLKESFKPELINRIDSVVIFNSLAKADVLKITNLMINKVINRLAKKNIRLEISDSAKLLVCDKGYSEEYGARWLRKVIDKEISDPLAEMIIARNLGANTAIRVDASSNKFDFQILC